jgi:TRAP-type C4-dicarboxylate transport system substrate-binding protein
VRRPVHEPGDLHGLKIRVPPSDIFIDAVAALGANPTPLPFGEVYSAMQTHLIEGAENNWRTFHTSRQFEVAHYWSQTDHSHSPEALLLSKRTYDALSPGDREIVVEAARASVPYMRGLWDKMEAASRAHVLAAGIKANEVNIPAFRKAAAPSHDRYLADPTLRRLFDNIRALA